MFGNVTIAIISLENGTITAILTFSTNCTFCGFTQFCGYFCRIQGESFLSHNIHISTSKTPLLFLPWSTKPCISCLNLRFHASIASTFYFILWAQATQLFFYSSNMPKVSCVKAFSLILHFACNTAPTCPLFLLFLVIQHLLIT